jgi:hypothetical protein
VSRSLKLTKLRLCKGCLKELFIVLLDCKWPVSKDLFDFVVVEDFFLQDGLCQVLNLLFVNGH